MGLIDRAKFAVILLSSLTRLTSSQAQGATGWTHQGDLDHTNVTQSMRGDILVEGKIDGGSRVHLTSEAGSITIDGKIDGGSIVQLGAAGDVRMGVVGGDGDKKIDGKSIVWSSSGGKTTLGNKIDGGANVTFLAWNGIEIGDKIDGESRVYLGTARGLPIHIHGKIANRYTVVRFCGHPLIVDGGIHDGAYVQLETRLCQGPLRSPSPGADKQFGAVDSDGDRSLAGSYP